MLGVYWWAATAQVRIVPRGAESWGSVATSLASGDRRRRRGAERGPRSGDVGAVDERTWSVSGGASAARRRAGRVRHRRAHCVCPAPITQSPSEPDGTRGTWSRRLAARRQCVPARPEPSVGGKRSTNPCPSSFSVCKSSSDKSCLRQPRAMRSDGVIRPHGAAPQPLPCMMVAM